VNLRLAPRAQVSLGVATQRARDRGRDLPSSVDLLHTLIEEADPVAGAVLKASGIDPAMLVARSGALAELEPGPNPLAAAGLEATRRGQMLVSAEHLLLGMLAQPRDPVALALAEQVGDLRPLRGQVWRTMLDNSPGGRWEAAGSGTPWSQVAESVGCLRASTSALPAPRRAAIERALDGMLREEPIVGLAACVIEEGRLVHTGIRGFADLESAQAFDASTLFRAGSVTKLLTAVAVLQLQERAMIDLDEPAARYLRSFPLPDRAVTVLDLLIHTSGLPTGHGLRHYRGPLPTVAEQYARDENPTERRGRWRYSNYGYAALGLLIEDVTGEPLPTYLDQHVLTPLGMTASRCDALVPASARAVGYAIDQGKVIPVRETAVVTAGAGFLWSTVSDLACFVSAVLDGGAGAHGRILAAETLSTMTRPWMTTAMPRLAQGLGFLLWSTPTGTTAAGHTGDVPGHHCIALADLQRGRGTVVAANTDTGLLTNLALDLLS